MALGGGEGDSVGGLGLWRRVDVGSSDCRALEVISVISLLPFIGSSPSGDSSSLPLSLSEEEELEPELDEADDIDDPVGEEDEEEAEDDDDGPARTA